MNKSVPIDFSKLEGSKDEEKSSKFVQKEKGKHVAHAIVYETIKPLTRPVNKMRLNAKIRLNPSLKDLVINIDEDKYEDEEKTQVSRRKRTKQQKQVRKKNTEHLLE